MASTTNFDPKRTTPRRGQPVRSRPDPAALVKLLDTWMQEDEAEQRETLEVLRRALDEDRPAGYKLFS